MLADQSACLVSAAAAADDENAAANVNNDDSTATAAAAAMAAATAPSPLLSALVSAVLEAFTQRVKARLLQTSEAAACRVSDEPSKTQYCTVLLISLL